MIACVWLSGSTDVTGKKNKNKPSELKIRREQSGEEGVGGSLFTALLHYYLGAWNNL